MNLTPSYKSLNLPPAPIQEHSMIITNANPRCPPSEIFVSVLLRIDTHISVGAWSTRPGRDLATFFWLGCWSLPCPLWPSGYSGLRVSQHPCCLCLSVGHCLVPCDPRRPSCVIRTWESLSLPAVSALCRPLPRVL